VTFTVVRPTAKITPRTASPHVVGNILFFGNAAPPQDGIVFSNAISVPINFSGSTVWVQIATKPDKSLLDNRGINHKWTENGDPPYGDFPIPYNALQEGGGTNYADSPSVEPESDGRVYVAESANQGFEMWMMFKPSGGICVPLRAVNWSWSATARNIAGTWTLQSGATNSVNPTDFDTITFPTWNSAVGDGHYTP
jgi:hypothetical protein